MTKEDLINAIRKREDSRIRFAVTDIDGILRGKIIHRDKFLDAVESGLGFCDVVFGWDANDAAYDNVQLTGWHTGYPDTTARIDLSTFRSIPWEDDIPFFLGDFLAPSGDHPACPRSLLRRILTDLEAMGFKAKFSQEFEWFNFRETPDSLSAKDYHSPHPISPGMFGYSVLRASQHSPFINDLFQLLARFGVPLEGLHTETGPGVYEAAIQKAHVLEAADRALLFKTGVKEIAYRHGYLASFMAKWNETLPGCSGHIHQSLWDSSRNLFHDPKAENQMSDLLKSYLAGQLYCLPHILPMYAPTINSYKRLVEGAWAPTTITWGIENRTTAVRVINSSASSARLETRVPGSDANPYLAIAAALASGLYGIKKKLKLDIPPTQGNGYENKKHGVLPSGLKEATAKMKTSEIAGELFGEAFVDHFTKTREWECREYARHVSNWELRRYFEII